MNKYQVVSDTSPLIAFIKKTELNILKLLFEKIFIPKAVYDELLYIPSGLDEEKKIIKHEIGEKWIIIDEVSEEQYGDLDIGVGETEAINLCLEKKNPLLLIDEKQGRNVARTLKINILGTMGILLLAYKNGLKDKKELFKNLNSLIKHGFYLSSEVILHLINELDEND
jgi:predicted nucleic acid-binding protein